MHLLQVDLRIIHGTGKADARRSNAKVSVVLDRKDLRIGRACARCLWIQGELVKWGIALHKRTSYLACPRPRSCPRELLAMSRPHIVSASANKRGQFGSALLKYPTVGSGRLDPVDLPKEIQGLASYAQNYFYSDLDPVRFDLHGSPVGAWGYSGVLTEQAENYEQESQQMQLSPAELFAYQYDYTMQAADTHHAPHSATSLTYWPAEQYRGAPCSPTASSSPLPVYDAQQMDYQASPLTLAGPTSFTSPTLGYTYAHSHLNVYTQPTYGYTYEHIDSDGYHLGASSTANEYSLDYPAVTSTVDTIG
ncbi:hypothetical protein HETIRDRAFT_121153, partial [Heterobasidion irregulare TC 32-1]